MTAGRPADRAAELEARAPVDPLPFYRWLRTDAPVYAPPGAGVHLVSRHRDVDRLLRDRRVRPQGPSTLLASLPDPEDVRRLVPLREFYERWLVFSGGPEHERVRAALRPLFAPARIGPALPDLAELAAGLVPAAGRLDVLADLGRPLAAAVVAGLTDLSGPDLDRLLAGSDAAIGFLTALDPTAAAGSALDAAAGFDRTAALLRERGGSWAGQALAAVAGAGAAGAGGAVLAQVVTGILEPLPHLVANGVRAILADPAQTARWRAAGADHGAMVDELARLGCPFAYVPRVTAEPTEVGGVTLPAGARVLGLLLAANTDPDEYADPERLDLDRRAGAGLAFGVGAHYCPGAAVARQVVAAAVSALLAAGRDARVVGEPEPVPSLGLHGLRALVVEVGPEPPGPGP